MKQEDNGGEGKKEKKRHEKNSSWQFVEYKETKKWSAEPAVKLQKLSSGLEIPTFNFKVMKPGKSSTKIQTPSPKATRKRSLTAVATAAPVSLLKMSKSSDCIVETKGSTELAAPATILYLSNPIASAATTPPVPYVSYEQNSNNNYFEWTYPTDEIAEMIFGNESKPEQLVGEGFGAINKFAAQEQPLIENSDENLLDMWFNNNAKA